MIFILMLCLGCCARAQQRLPFPLEFVAADSIVIWGGGTSDFRGAALAADASLRSHVVRADSGTAASFETDARRWSERVLPRLNLVGGLGDAGASGQAEGAMQVVAAAAPLLLQTADAQYADAIERAVFNALCAAVSAPGGMSFDKHVAAQTLMDAAGMVYATDSAGVYVNLYLNTSAHIVTPRFDFVLDQMTAMPFDGLVKLRLTGLGPGRHRLKLRFRMPAWALCRAFPAGTYAVEGEELPLPVVYVNGREPLRQGFENGYVVIDREWVSGDEVYFVLPVRPAWVRADGRSAVLCGPLVYALSGQSPGRRPVAGMTLRPADEVNAQGNLVLEAAPPAASAEIDTLCLEPYMDCAGQVWMGQ